MNFYNNLERICKLRNKSIPEAMDAIGSTRYTAYSWKRRGTVPDAETVQKLAAHLHCSMEELLVFAGEAAPHKENAPTETDERTERFVELFNRLTDEQKDIVLAQLEGIVAKL